MPKAAKQKRPGKQTPARKAGAVADRYAALQPGPVRPSREIHISVVLFVSALALRLVYFFINKNNNPLFQYPILDALYHHEWADRIAHGDFWGNEVFFRAPFYAYFLAFLYKLSGSSIAFAVLAQHILGSMSVVLVYWLARQFFSVRVAILSGALAALYWPLIYYEGELLIVTLAVFLDVALLILLTIGFRRSSRSLHFAAGIVFGISAITRPNILIMLAVIPAVFHLQRGPGQKTSSAFPWLRSAAWSGAGFLVIVMPVMMRNYVVGRDIVPIASQGGVNFYIGNNPTSNGSRALVPGTTQDLHGTYQGAIALAEQEVGHKMKPSEVSNYYFRKGLGFVVTSPGAALALTFKKLYLFWAGVERSNTKYIQFFWRRYGLGRIPLPGFWLVGPFGLLGGVLLWRRRRELSLLYLYALLYMAGVVAFFVNARFRLPVVPVLIVFSSYAIWYLGYAIRRRPSDFLKAGAVLVLCLFVVDYDFVAFRGVRADDLMITHYSLGSAYLKMGDESKALAEYEECRATFEKYPTRSYAAISNTVDIRLGSIYWEKGEYARAIAPLERIGPDDAAALRAWKMLADCYEHLDRPDKVIETYTRITEHFPGDGPSLLALGRAYMKSGDREKALRYLNEALPFFPKDPSIAEDIRTLRDGH